MTIPDAHPDFCCPTCGETFIVTGETPIARERAIRDWAGCCTETTAGPTDGEADGPAAPTTRSLLRGLLSGVPEWVRRRVEVGGAGVAL